MAIIVKFRIDEFRETIPGLAPGLVYEDDNASTWNLANVNDPNYVNEYNLTLGVPAITSDFYDLAQQGQRSLFALVTKETLDTGRMTYNDFSKLTMAQYQQFIQNGTFVLRVNILGWVYLGKSYLSVYYETCSNGKRPIVDSYYSLNALDLRNEIVASPETPVPMTQFPDYQATFGNWGKALPGVMNMSLRDYIRLTLLQEENMFNVLPGTFQPRYSGGLKTGIPLLYAERNPANQEIGRTNDTGEFYLESPYTLRADGEKFFEGIQSIYARDRWTIGEGFKAGLGVYDFRIIGNCIPDGRHATGGGGGETDGVFRERVGTESDLTETQLGDARFKDGLPPIDPCGEWPLPINFPPYEQITANEADQKWQVYGAAPNDPRLEQVAEADPPDREMDYLRKHYQVLQKTSGVKDPREFISDNYEIPMGTLQVRYNEKTCTYDIFPALRDKDGDIPEPIGPILSSYFENVRKNMMTRFGITSTPLQLIGSGSDGYRYYSDGNSYVELLGEAVFGCGDPLSFGLDIPEVVVAIDNYTKNVNALENLYSSVKWGPQAITDYLMDMAYGIPADSYVNESGFEVTDRWQNVMHSIYKEISEDVNIDYNQIDDAISIKSFGTMEEIKRNQISTGLTWDWLISRGFGNFSVSVKYKFGTGTGDGHIDFIYLDVVGLVLFFAGVVALAIDWLVNVFEPSPQVSPSPEEKRLTRHFNRRLHKKGNLVLMSKSGAYYTSYKPCEQIFLGFADRSYYKSRNPATIESLQKIDRVDRATVTKAGKIYPQQGVRGFSTIENIPYVDRRMKKYGRNPLLDVFYLNMCGIAKTNNRYSAERRFSHPTRLPFRPSSNTQKNEWGSLKYGQFPTMFPQNWNSKNIANEYNKFVLTKHQASSTIPAGQREITWGDKFWENRVSNVILPLKDRWELSIQYAENDVNKPVAVLKDKTSILDLYFSLMEMHVKGVSWGEILGYADLAIGCVSGGEYNEKLDVKKLESIWNLVKNRLNEISLEEEPNPETLYIGSHDFGEVLIADEFVASTNREIYAGDVYIHNSTDRSFTIQSIELESNGIRDPFGRELKDYFRINGPLLNGWDGSNPPPIIPARNSNGLTPESLVKIPIWFIPKQSSSNGGVFSAQPNFRYSALVEVTFKDNVSGDVATIAGDVTAVCVTDVVTDSYEEGIINPIISQRSIDFGNEDTTLPLIYSNQNRQHDVLLKRFRVENFVEYTNDGQRIESNYTPFEIEGQQSRFNMNAGQEVNFLVVNQTLPSLSDPMEPEIFTTNILFRTDNRSGTQNSEFYADLIMEYEMNGATFEKKIELTAIKTV